MEDLATDLVVVEDSSVTVSNQLVKTVAIVAALALPTGYVLGNLIVGKYRSWRASRNDKTPAVVTND